MYFLIEEYLTPQDFTGEATVEEDDKDPEPSESEEEEIYYIAYTIWR